MKRNLLITSLLALGAMLIGASVAEAQLVRKTVVLLDAVTVSQISPSVDSSIYQTAGFQQFGTGFPTGSTIFQGTVDGANWVSLNCYPVNSSTGTSTPSAAGVYRCNIAGFTAIRANLSITSGTATVSVKLDTGHLGTLTP